MENTNKNPFFEWLKSYTNNGVVNYGITIGHSPKYGCDGVVFHMMINQDHMPAEFIGERPVGSSFKLLPNGKVEPWSPEVKSKEFYKGQEFNGLVSDAVTLLQNALLLKGDCKEINQDFVCDDECWNLKFTKTGDFFPPKK